MAAQRVSLSIQDDKPLDANGNDVSKGDISATVEERFASNPFADPEVADHYRTIYEKCQYECRHGE